MKQSAMTIPFWIANTDTANRSARKLRDEPDLYSPQQGLALTLTIDQLFGLNPGQTSALIARFSRPTRCRDAWPRSDAL
jgi:hypothetical protein